MEFENLKVGYHEEWQSYPTFYKKVISCNDMKFIADKISRHFKLPKPSIHYWGYRKSQARKLFREIYLSSRYGMNFGTLCHELNHFLCWKEIDLKKYSDRPIKNIRHGTKKWNRNLQKLLKYCQKKNFWEEEIIKRNEPKPMKPEPTKDELKMRLIEHLQENCKRYQTKIKMYSNKLKKTERKIMRLSK